MASQRIANIRKKTTPSPPKVSTPTVEDIPEPKFVVLYFADDCEFCKELIRILLIVPILAERVQCVNVNNYEVDPKIECIPTIDTGEDELYERYLEIRRQNRLQERQKRIANRSLRNQVPLRRGGSVNNLSTLHENDIDEDNRELYDDDVEDDDDGEEIAPNPLRPLGEAFSWVVHQCYRLLETRQIDNITLTNVERRVRNVFRELQEDMYRKMYDYDDDDSLSFQLMRRGTGENPADKFHNHLKEKDDRIYSMMDHSGKRKSKELYKRYLEEEKRKNHHAKQQPIDERLKNLAKERSDMMEKYKRKWRKHGSKKKTVKRESLRSVRSEFSEAEIKNYEAERMQMLDPIKRRYAAEIIEPMKKSAVRLGSAVTDRDIQEVEIQRQKMMQRVRSRYE